MARLVDTKEYLDMVCALLREGKENVCVPVKGVSMRPFLRDQDLVYLNRIRQPVKPGDILLFQRPNGQYILHRVYRIAPDGRYLMLGDSQSVLEPIASDQALAIVSFARIGGKEVRPGSVQWWIFAKPWRWLAPLRKQILHMYGTIKGK